MLSRTSIERRLAYNSGALLFFMGAVALLGFLRLGNVWIASVLVLAVAVTIPLTVAISRSITSPLCSIGSAAKDLSQGKLSVILDAQARKDEIGELISRFRGIADYVKEM